MARRRRATGSAWVAWLGLALAFWLSGRAFWSSADTAPPPRTPPVASEATPAAPEPNSASPDATSAPPVAPSPRIPTVAVDPQSVWASRAACEAAIGSIVAQPRAELRVASWNLHWFPDARSDQTSKAGGTDVAWMACAMASLRADVIAVQEVLTNLPGRSALSRLLTTLDAHTGGHWQSYLDACPADRRQHVGFLYDTARVQLDQLRDVPELNPYGGACAKRLRPGVAAHLKHGALAFDLITLHFDSGDEDRDYQHRLQSVRTLTQLFSPRVRPRVLALGDFNTMGCERCNPPVSVDHELGELSQLLHDAGYRSVAAVAEQPMCSHHFDGRAQLLDRAITTLPARGVRLHPAGLCAELLCQRPRTTSDALERLSDHCPIVVEIAAP